MDSFQTEIARFLVSKALRKSRTTYQQVAESVAWSHPYGRGLGNHLEVILRELKERGLPALTTILVKKGSRHPPDDAMPYIRRALGDLDVERLQEDVFAFDWTTISDLAPSSAQLPAGRQVWLTSVWAFDPAGWGCIGFADENRRERFVRSTAPSVLVAIYVTKNKGPEDMRGKVVGVLEVSHDRGHAHDFISGDRWAEKEADPDSRGKWVYALRVTRAWRIVPEDWCEVDEIFANLCATQRRADRLERGPYRSRRSHPPLRARCL
jgi:hypothetical protein